MGCNLTDKDIEKSLNRSLEKIPWEIKKIKIFLSLVKIFKRKSIKKNLIIQVIVCIYVIITMYIFFKK